jgi:RelA/SpoT family (p)ppGpp synthetase
MPPIKPDSYPHLSYEFLERFQELVNSLELPHNWHDEAPGYILHCLETVDRFYAQLESYLEPEDQALVTRALLVAFEAHGLVLRKSNDELFFEHPLWAAEYLARHRLDAPTLAATLLHDVAEDTTVSISQIVEDFGSEVGKLVEGVTKLQATGKEVSSKRPTSDPGLETTNKLFQFMVEDVRVVLVKLADRLHNMRTLDALSPVKQREKAREVLAVYAPLAYRMGMWDVKSELEELAFKTLYPSRYHQFKKLREQQFKEQRFWLRVVKESMTEELAKAGITARIEHDPEQIYSLYRDYQQDQGLPARLADTLRVVVLVEKETDCYQALGVLHGLWSPMPGTFDDYIALPRENLYQALHTTVFGPGGRLLKVRFRTFSMHEVAHRGILARWSGNVSEPVKGFEAVQRLMKRLDPVRAIDEQGQRSAAYREALTDQIQVFTPEGELIELPVGATPLDFAYQIHTRLGDEARRAYINGSLRPLNTTLKSGDQVRIERVRGGLPLREWLDEDLDFVQTMYARSKIRQAFRRLDRDEALDIGRQAIEREMEMMGSTDYDLAAVADDLEYPAVDALLVDVASGNLTSHKVATVALKSYWDGLEATPVGGFVVSPDGTVTVRGIPGRPMRMCGTCKPQPGDSIVGNLLRGGQVTVHRMDCHHIVQRATGENRLNLVPVDWAREPRTVRTVHIRVAVIDRSGLVFRLAQVFSAEGVNISEFYGRADPERQVGLVTATIEVFSLRQLSRVLHRVAQLPEVKAVQRTADPLHCCDDPMEWAIRKAAIS